MLKPALSAREIQTIGATTSTNTGNTSRRTAPSSAVQPVIVKAPSVPEAIEIIKGLRHKYEAHHRVKITSRHLRSRAPRDRYITDRQLPTGHRRDRRASSGRG